MSAVAERTDTDEPILLRRDADNVATLTLNRPKQYNALSEAMLAELQTALDAIAADDSVRVVVIAGAGKAFCAGHDLKEMRGRPEQDYYTELFRQCGRVMRRLVSLPQPVVARVHGIATAAGCQLVGAADLAVASTDARFATSGINVGLFCATPSVTVSRNLGRKRAFEMLFTGDFIDAEQAVALGLANRAVAPDRLDEAVNELAARIAGKPTTAVRRGKEMFYRQLEMTLDDALNYAAEVMACNMMDGDTSEGIDAFIEKRRPAWYRG